MTTVATAFPVIVGSVVAVLGLALMWFRVEASAFFKNARVRFGMSNPDSQTPLLAFVVGAGFFIVGAVFAVGTLAGWVHPQ